MHPHPAHPLRNPLCVSPCSSLPPPRICFYLRTPSAPADVTRSQRNVAMPFCLSTIPRAVGKHCCIGEGSTQEELCDIFRSVNGTASKCKTFLATATEECCPAKGTLAGHFTRRLSPSPMPGKRIQ